MLPEVLTVFISDMILGDGDITIETDSLAGDVVIDLQGHTLQWQYFSYWR